MLYLAVVNIVKLRSILILISRNELNLALLSFPDCKVGRYIGGVVVEETCEYESISGDTHDMTDLSTNTTKSALTMDLGSRVSRKKDFIPSLTQSIVRTANLPCRSLTPRAPLNCTHFFFLLCIAIYLLTNCTYLFIFFIFIHY